MYAGAQRKGDAEISEFYIKLVGVSSNSIEKSTIIGALFLNYYLNRRIFRTHAFNLATRVKLAISGMKLTTFEKEIK